MNRPDRKVQLIEQRLDEIDAYIQNAREYVERNINVRGKAFLHFDDWKGNSGHPSWMKNHMIPARTRGRARIAKRARDLEDNTKDKRLAERKRRGGKLHRFLE